MGSIESIYMLLDRKRIIKRSALELMWWWWWFFKQQLQTTSSVEKTKTTVDIRYIESIIDGILALTLTL